MAEVALSANLRKNPGSSNSRRLRTSGQIPGVVYGHGIDPTSVSVEAKSLRLALNTDAGLNALINLDVEGKKHLTLARSVQLHPVRNTVSHVDFQVVSRNEVMTVEVPFAFIGEADELRKAGGILEHVLNTLTVSATPTNIPAHIEIDVTNVNIDDSIRVNDIKLPNGVTTEVDPEEAIVIGKITPKEESLEAASGEGEAAEGEQGSGEGAGEEASADAEAENKEG